MEVKVEVVADLSSNDDSSVIFVSDMSVSEDDDEVVELEKSSADIKEIDEQFETECEIIPQVEEVIVTETETKVVEAEVEETVLKLDKATQTYVNEFPSKPVPVSADHISSAELVQLSNALQQDVTESNSSDTRRVNISVPVSSTVSNNRSNNASTSASSHGTSTNKKANESGSVSTSCDTSATNKKVNNNVSTSKAKESTTRGSDSYNRKNSSASSYENPVNSNNSRNPVRRTWTKTRTYQNCRMQPYQRNNNAWNNPPNNYYSRQNNYNRYGNQPSNNYNRYGTQPLNNYNNNRYSTQPYNNYHNRQSNWQVQRYTYQFKERLFTGFVRFMDFVFQYDYSRNARS